MTKNRYAYESAQEILASGATLAAAAVVPSTDYLLGYQSATKTEKMIAIDQIIGPAGKLIPAGATLSATVAAHNNRDILLDTAAGSVVTLPAATGSGAVFRFKVSVTATGSHIVKVADDTDLFFGQINILDLDGSALSAFKANGTDADTITLNHTTTGGIKGDWLEVQDIGANAWFVKGQTTCVTSSNPATPFSSTV